jgi:hypothetical protein
MASIAPKSSEIFRISVFSRRRRTMADSKRLDLLVAMAARPSADSFTHYALAMEYKSLGRTDEALSAFEALRARDPEYLPMYMMCGTMLAAEDKRPAARQWLEQGLAVARRQNQAHTMSELEAALSAIAD